MSCLQALLAKLRFEKAEPILKMHELKHELQKVLGHIARDMLARPNLRIKAPLVETIWARQSPLLRRALPFTKKTRAVNRTSERTRQMGRCSWAPSTRTTT